MKLKRLSAAIMSAAMAISMGGGVLSAYAAEEAHTGSTTVTATVGSSYSIIVPQAITLENEAGGNGSGTYTNTFNVTVKGDIGENQTVKVTATPPTMTCSGAAGVAATFEDGYKTEWSRAEATGTGTAAAYTVKAVDLTPGSWSGTAMFNCSLETVSSSSTISFSIKGVSYQAEEGMTWAEWVDSDYNTGGYYISGNTVQNDVHSITSDVAPDVVIVNGTNYNVERVR